MEEKLIELVQKYPLLYDPLCKDYSNQDARRNAWEEIGVECGAAGYVCKGRWRKVRNAYTNALKRRKDKTGKSANSISKWNHMSFLGLDDEHSVDCDESDEEEKLIELVRKYPLLYDPSCKDYSYRDARRNAWEEIGEECGATGYVCKERWTKVRNAYTNALRRRKGRTGELAKSISKWKHMSFLGLDDEQHTVVCDESDDENCYKTDENSIIDTPADIPNTSQVTDSKDFVLTVANDREPSPIAFHQNSPPTNTQRPKKRRLVNTTISEMFKVIKENNRKQSRYLPLPTESAQQYHVNDETELLFLSLARTVKKLSPEEQARVKMDITNVIFQAEFRHAQCTKPDPYDYQPQSPLYN